MSKRLLSALFPNFVKKEHIQSQRLSQGPFGAGLKKGRKYLKPGEKAPEGANVQTGPQGGQYYDEMGGGGGAGKEQFLGGGAQGYDIDYGDPERSAQVREDLDQEGMGVPPAPEAGPEISEDRNVVGGIDYGPAKPEIKPEDVDYGPSASPPDVSEATFDGQGNIQLPGSDPYPIGELMDEGASPEDLSLLTDAYEKESGTEVPGILEGYTGPLNMDSFNQYASDQAQYEEAFVGEKDMYDAEDFFDWMGSKAEADTGAVGGGAQGLGRDPGIAAGGLPNPADHDIQQTDIDGTQNANYDDGSGGLLDVPGLHGAADPVAALKDGGQFNENRMTPEEREQTDEKILTEGQGWTDIDGNWNEPQMVEDRSATDRASRNRIKEDLKAQGYDLGIGLGFDPEDANYGQPPQDWKHDGGEEKPVKVGGEEYSDDLYASGYTTGSNVLNISFPDQTKPTLAWAMRRDLEQQGFKLPDKTRQQSRRSHSQEWTSENIPSVTENTFTNDGNDYIYGDLSEDQKNAKAEKEKSLRDIEEYRNNRATQTPDEMTDSQKMAKMMQEYNVDNKRRDPVILSNKGGRQRK